MQAKAPNALSRRLATQPTVLAAMRPKPGAIVILRTKTPATFTYCDRFRVGADRSKTTGDCHGSESKADP